MSRPDRRKWRAVSGRANRSDASATTGRAASQRAIIELASFEASGIADDTGDTARCRANLSPTKYPASRLKVKQSRIIRLQWAVGPAGRASTTSALP